MIKQNIIYTLLLLLVLVGSTCDDDDMMPDDPCVWAMPTEPFVLGNCFFPETIPSGQFVIPPTEGNEMVQIAFDPNNDDLLYFTDWQKDRTGGSAQ